MVKDYLGNEFETIKIMCNQYNITPAMYQYRLRHNWTLEDTLLTPPSGTSKLRKSEYRDHKGNEFRTQQEMCDFWKVSLYAFMDRKKTGKSLEECLTGSAFRDKFLTSIDHKGNEFPTRKAMCDFWNVNEATYRARIRKGFSIEEALTSKPKIRHEVDQADKTDHHGICYNTAKEMCRKYNIHPSTFRKLRAQGYSKDQILSKYEDKMNRKLIESETSWKVERLVYTSEEGTMFYLCITGNDDEEVLNILTDNNAINQDKIKEIKEYKDRKSVV